MTSAEIQQLIDDQVTNGGGEVLLPAGTHDIGAPLRVSPGITLRGDGTMPLLRSSNKEINIIEVAPGSSPVPHDVVIRDLRLEGPSDNTDITHQAASNGATGCGILVSARKQPGVDEALRNITIRGCRIENVSGSGIRFDTREDVLMQNIIIQDCNLLQNRRHPEPDDVAGSAPDAFKDIYFYGTRFENITITGNTCSFTPTPQSTYGNDSGIAFVGNFDNKVDGNRLPRGQWFLGLVKDTEIHDNTCIGHRRHGIAIYGFLVTENVTVKRNTCRDNRWVGLYIAATAGVDKGDLLAEENRLEHNGYGGSSTDPNNSIRGGIVLNEGYNSRFVRNKCNNNGRPSADFSDPDDSAQFAAGIRIRGKDIVLDNNELNGNEDDPYNCWGHPCEGIVTVIESPGKNGDDSNDETPDDQEEEDKEKKKSIFKRFFGWIKGLFGK